MHVRKLVQDSRRSLLVQWVFVSLYFHLFIKPQHFHPSASQCQQCQHFIRDPHHPTLPSISSVRAPPPQKKDADEIFERSLICVWEKKWRHVPVSVQVWCLYHISYHILNHIRYYIWYDIISYHTIFSYII